MKKIYDSDSIQGPEAVAWAMRVMSIQADKQDRPFFLEQMKRATDDLTTMRRIKKGWEQYGMTPAQVCAHKPEKQIARYNSEPYFRSRREL